MQSTLPFLNFTYITEMRDKIYATRYYVSPYSVKNRAKLYNHMPPTYQIEKKIS